MFLSLTKPNWYSQKTLIAILVILSAKILVNNLHKKLPSTISRNWSTALASGDFRSKTKKLQLRPGIILPV